MRRTLLALALVAAASPAAAEKLSLGSMDIRPCVKGMERATLVLEISAPNFHRVQDELRKCAEHGVESATLPALLKNLPAAAPTFWEEFQVCTRYTEWVSADLTVEKSCRY